MNTRKPRLSKLALPAVIAMILASPAFAQQDQSDAKDRQAQQKAQADRAADASAKKSDEATQDASRDKAKDSKKSKAKKGDPTYEPEEDDDR